MKIGEIKTLLAGTPTPEAMALLRQDERAGVQKLLASYDKRQEKERKERERYAAMLTFERQYLELPGIRYVAGLDEAGRGPWPALWSLPASFYRPTGTRPSSPV